MEPLVGIAIAAFMAYVGFKRIEYVGAVFKRREKIERFEKALRDARANADGPSPWRPAGAGDAGLVALVAAARTDEASLALLGFRRLGDVVAGFPDRPPTLVMRVLARGHVVAGLMVTSTQPKRVRISLSSYGAEDQWTTMRGGDGRSLAMPPWLHIVHMDAGDSVADVVREHTAFLPPDLRVLATLDDVLANIATQRERVQRWRDAQPPDELLDADLRGLLGEHYAKSGAYWSKRLRGKLPDATLRRG